MGTIKKQNMDSLPEEIKNLLWEKKNPWHGRTIYARNIH